MFEIGFDQAAGLRARQRPLASAGLMAVACPAQPARAYELLCTLAAHLTALDRAPVIVDGSATESSSRLRGDGSHLGLLRALQDPSISGLACPVDGAEWLAMPGALGLQSLQETARAGGAGVALSRLLAPFAPEALVLLFAPAFSLGQLLGGSGARVLVPVLEQPQATFDTYGAVKLLHGAGLAPVLAPLASPDAASALQQTVDTVADCAQRHLGLALDAWPVHTWGHRVQEAALTCAPRAGQARPAPAATRTAGALPLWS
ncbi:MAG: hypothetical protein Q8K24_01725 [Hydrogenophaga sp.]|nr:hypothetical protein [Hydrogenophaga sp.]